MSTRIANGAGCLVQIGVGVYGAASKVVKSFAYTVDQGETLDGEVGEDVFESMEPYTDNLDEIERIM